MISCFLSTESKARGPPPSGCKKDGKLSIWIVAGRKHLAYTVPASLQHYLDDAVEIDSITVVERTSQDCSRCGLSGKRKRHKFREAIRTIANGRRYRYPPLSERAIDAYIQQAQTTPLDIYETVTNREREVFQLAAEGCTSVQIAERLSISARTVEVHRARVIHKLDLHSQTDLIRYALRRGILPLESDISP